MISIAHAVSIKIFSEEFLTIQSLSDVSLFNFATKSLDFKIKLMQQGNFEATCSQGKLSIGRHKHSLFFNFTEVKDDKTEESPVPVPAKLV